MCKPDLNRTVVSKLSTAYNINLKVKLGYINELSFNLPSNININNELISNTQAELTVERYLVKVKLNNLEEYFIINKINENIEETNNISVNAYSLGYELKNKLLRQYKNSSVNAQDVLSDILKNTSWSIKYIDVEFILKYRNFDITSKKVLDFITDIATTYNAVIIWDTINRKISLVKPENIGNNKGLSINYGKYLKSLNKEINSDEMVTRLKVFGQNDISIQEINPTGADYIEDFSHFLYPFERDEDKNVITSSKYMSDSLCNAILDYQELIIDNKINYNTYLTTLDGLQKLLNVKENEMTNLKDQMEIILDNIDTALAKTTEYSDDTTYEVDSVLSINGIPYICILESTGNYVTDTDYWNNLNTLKQNKQTEINTKQGEIDAINISIDNTNILIVTLQYNLSIEKNFTVEQIYERNQFIIEKEYVNQNIDNAQDLYDSAVKEFQTLKYPQIVVDINIINFLEIIEEQINWDKLNIGDTVIIKPVNVTAKIIEVDFDFENRDINLTIANVKDIQSNKNKFLISLYNSISTSNSVDINKYKWDGIDDTSNSLNNLIDILRNGVKSDLDLSVNQHVVMNGRGITVTDPNDYSRLLRINAGNIGISKTNGEIFETCINADGIISEKLIGKILLGEKLVIDATDLEGTKTMTVDSQGVVINGTTLTITNGLSPDQIRQDTIPPALTTITLVALTNGYIKISITKPIDTDLMGFNIWRSITDDSANSILIKSLVISSITCPSVLEYIDDTTVDNTTYYYWVTAIDSSGNESSKIVTNPTNILAKDTIIPSAPNSLVAKGGWGKIDLTWNAPTDKDIQKYKIECSKNSDFTVLETFVNTYNYDYSFATKYTHYDIVDIDIRYYRVYAIDKKGNISIASSTSFAKVTIAGDGIDPNPPNIINISTPIISDNNARLILTFNGSDSLDTSLYRIVRHTCTASDKTGDDGGIEAGLINHTGNIQYKFTDSYLVKNKYYYYSIYTIDNSGMICNTPLLLPITGAIQAIDNTPLSVSNINLQAIGSMGSITLKWNDIILQTSSNKTLNNDFASGLSQWNVRGYNYTDPDNLYPIGCVVDNTTGHTSTPSIKLSVDASTCRYTELQQWIPLNQTTPKSITLEAFGKCQNTANNNGRFQFGIVIVYDDNAQIWNPFGSQQIWADTETWVNKKFTFIPIRPIKGVYIEVNLLNWGNGNICNAWVDDVSLNEIDTEQNVTYEIWRQKTLPQEEVNYTKLKTVIGTTSGINGLNSFTDYDPPSNISCTWDYKLKAIDYWGNVSDFSSSVNASTLIGLIADTDYSNGFKFDPSENGDGMTITRSDNLIRVVMNATSGMKIQVRATTSEEWSDSLHNKFFIDNNGNLISKGHISINSGTAGELHANDTGLYLGASTFENAEFRVDPGGSLHAENADISGDIDCTTLKISGIDILSELNTKLNGNFLANGTVNADKINTTDLYAERIKQPEYDDNFGQIGGLYGDLVLYYNNGEYFRIYNDLNTSVDLKFKGISFIYSSGTNTYPQGNWNFQNATITNANIVAKLG